MMSAAAARDAQEGVLASLRSDLEWWRLLGTRSGRAPDLDATLCRIRAKRPHRRTGGTLTNMLLLRSRGGRFGAAILLDPADISGPLKRWPARAVAALLQLSLLQMAIDTGRLPTLPDFVAVLNPHDSPEQMALNSSWTGLLPLLSNSRIRGEHRDLLMPDYSFAPGAYLTSGLWMSAGRDGGRNGSLPRGWPDEFRDISDAGRRTAWREKRPALFWRGALTHPQREAYIRALMSGLVRMPAGVAADVRPPCTAHCSKLQGAVAPEHWCANQLLLSLPGHSFAVGFKVSQD